MVQQRIFHHSILSIVFLVFGLSIGCSDSADSADCVDSLCTPGESRCAGNYVATCDEDGLAWTYDFCGDTQYCKAGAMGSGCEMRQCTELGQGSCIDDATLVECNLNGSATETVTCPTGTVCPSGGGLCVSAECSDGETRCGFRAVLSCAQGVWEATSCAATELCAVDAGAAVCVERQCAPQQAWCEGQTSHICNLDGSAVDSSVCNGGQICMDGHCQSAVCGVEAPSNNASGDGGASSGDTAIGSEGDVSADDGGPTVVVPPLQKVSKIEFVLGGVKQVFDIGANAIYVNADKMLKISGGKTGGRKIEINIAGEDIQQKTVGSWTDVDISSNATAAICYLDNNNSVAPVADPLCGGDAGGFSHASSTYNVVVDENNGPSSYVVGTFEGVVADSQGNAVEIIDGTFDVLHK